MDKHELAEYIAKRSQDTLNVLYKIVMDEKVPILTRIEAARVFLDTVFGEPQAVELNE